MPTGVYESPARPLPGLPRRQFLKGLGVAALAAGLRPVWSASLPDKLRPCASSIIPTSTLARISVRRRRL